MQINAESSLKDCLSYLQWLDQNKIKLGLARVLMVAERLGLCNFNCTVITVTGTNGKGTCIETMRYFLNKLGYNVGVYTSPHVLDVLERVQINAQKISAADCCSCFYAIYKNLDEQELTYFEFITLVALYYFKVQDNAGKLDFILLEIGIGGTLDVVNIVQNDIAVITSIGLDHCEYLGETKQEIAHEKAGIIKNDSFVVCGEDKITQPFIDKARFARAKLKLLGRDYTYKINPDLSWEFCLGDKLKLSNLPEINFACQNVATALTVLDNMVPRFWQQVDLYKNLPDLALVGRLMQINRGNLQYTIDCAHNPAAAKWLASKCQKKYARAYIVFGCCKSKDHLGMMEEFLDLAAGWYLVEFINERSTSTEVLSAGLNRLYAKRPATNKEISVTACNSVALALQQIALDMLDVSTSINIIIFGSFHVVEAAISNIGGA
jgi:dihydrofolate synthase/folylpolyglutamate synthase